MFYKYETHLHTSEVSVCARSTACEMVHAYIDAGYSGIIITDHFINGNSIVIDGLSWKDQINRFLRGFRNAELVSGKYNFDVFLGWEYTNHPYGEDFLTYNLTPQFLYDHPEIMEMDISEYSKIVRNHGGLLVQAHPYREAHYIKYKPNPKINLIDGIEVNNGESNSPNNNNDKAWVLARNNPHLIRISGTDIHHTNQVGLAGIAFEYRINSMQEFVDCLKAGEGYLIIDGKVTDRNGKILE